jgi:transcriptional regulator of acetoin/glycerol metabolism
LAKSDERLIAAARRLGSDVVGESTVPTNDSDQDEPVRQQLVLKWLFPEQARPLHLLTGARYTIGRGEDCELRLESKTVSRHHAEIYRQGPIFAIRDLSSKNGVHLNGERTVHGPLRAGLVLRISDHVGLIAAYGSAHSQPHASFGEIAPGLFGGEKLEFAIRPLKEAAQHDLPIILNGETGTGKERVARSIHTWSNRSGPFHAVNCAALPAATVEGELFGYRKGAFTGAVQSHVGHLRAAHGGTLFLDEIAELSLEMQAKLLRVIEDRQVVALGESGGVHVDIRIVCACQEPLRTLIAQGRFRSDLHARLAGYTCLLPPLRERIEDVPHLLAAFLCRYTQGNPPAVDAKVVERLCLYRWPDNVRELDLLTRQLLVLNKGMRLTSSLLPEHIAGTLAPRTEIVPSPRPDRGGYDLDRLIDALRRTGGNVTKAADRLGLSRQRAYRLMAGRTAAELLLQRNANGAARS